MPRYGNGSLRTKDEQTYGVQGTTSSWAARLKEAGDTGTGCWIANNTDMRDLPPT